MTMKRRRHPHFETPAFAAPVFAAFDEKARRRGERIVRRPIRENAAVAVIVDTDVEPHFWHPLSVTHGAGPGTNHLLGRGHAALHDDQRIDEFTLPVGAPARFGPG